MVLRVIDMRNMSKAIAGLFVFVITTSVPFSALAQSDVPEKGQVRFANETEEQLLAMGCEKVLVTNKQALDSARLLGWLAVIPIDASGQEIAFCSPQVVRQLQPLQEGEVLGSDSLRRALFSSLGGVGLVLSLLAESGLWEPPSGSDILAAGSEMAAAGLLKLFNLLYEFGSELFRLLASLVAPLLTWGEFTSSPVVQRLWPVVLGIANLGFLLALVIIALLVTLRSDVGGGVRKLLPRLLLGAVLINFSLVIGGAIIDVSRLVMAIISSLFDVGALETSMLVELKDSSGLHSLSIVPRLVGLELAGWGSVVGSLFEVMLVWLLNIAMIVIIVSLVVRYLALLLLLIISPFAYVALAFPGAQKIAISWWSNFLKYVAFGPILLIILLTASRSADFIPTGLFDTTSGTGQAALLLLRVMVFSTGMIFAAIAGRYAGIAGSSMALNIVTKGGKRARSLAYRGGSFAGRKGAKAAYVGSGVRRGSRYIRAATSDALKPARRLTSTGEFSKYDPKTGKMKEGKSTKFGSAIGRGLEKAGIGRGKDYGTTKDVKSAMKIHGVNTDGRMSTGARASMDSDARLSANNLRGTDTKRSAGENEMNTVASNTKDVDKVQAIAQDANYVKGLSDQGAINLMQSINSNTQISNPANVGPKVPTTTELTAAGITDSAEQKTIRANVWIEKVKLAESVQRDAINAIMKARQKT